MGISRQAYYKRIACERERHERNTHVIELVSRTRVRQPRLGTRKLHYLLRERLQMAGMKVGRDALFDILRSARMLVTPRKAYHKTTNSHHHYRRHANLLKGETKVVPSGCEQLWVADMTYLPTRDKAAYLSLVTDAYSRKIVGWHVHEGQDAEDVSAAFKMALRHRHTEQRLVHHSDRGIQYCSAFYQQIHRRHGITCSMTDGYDCYQNALAERVNGILKDELLLHRPLDLGQAAKMVKESIRIYNEERPHLSLEYKTPDEVHRASLRSQTGRNRPEKVST